MELIIKRRDFPSGIARFCTKQLKQIAFARWYEENIYDNTIPKNSLKHKTYGVWFGIRTEESRARKEKYSKLNRKEYYDPNLIFPKSYRGYIAKHYFSGFQY